MTDDPTDVYLRMYAAMRDGNLEQARELAHSLQELLQVGILPPNYCPTEVRSYLASVLRRTAGIGSCGKPREGP